MASRRTTFTPKGRTPTDAHCYAELIAGILDGTVNADTLVESRDKDGHLKLEFDDPRG
jgi:hypothetical protein